jgi:hypothetical protein
VGDAADRRGLGEEIVTYDAIPYWLLLAAAVGWVWTERSDLEA